MSPRRRVLLLSALLVGASAWLAAGPGGVTVLAALACRHHAAAHPMPMGGGARHSGTPGAPCYCDHMAGSADAVTAPALPAPPLHAFVPALPVVACGFPIPHSPASGFDPAPTPPPPNGRG